MAVVKRKQDLNRTKLETVIPIKTPYVLQLAVSSLCTFKCVYCPVKDGRFGKGFMDFRTYTKIIDDLFLFPDHVKVIRLVKEGEPLFNDRFVDMIRYAKMCFPRVVVDTTTNAFFLTPKLSDEIISAGLDKIFISLQGITNEAYRKVAGVSINFDTLKEHIFYFCRNKKQCKVYIKVPDMGVTSKEIEMFFKMFDDYADEVFVERMVPTWPDFDFSKYKKDDGIGYYGNPVNPKYVNICAFPFYIMPINHDGTVAHCQLDWKRTYSLGDVTKQNLYEIWNGKVFNDFRKIHLLGERQKHYLCGKCQGLQYCEVDNIDSHSENLLRKFL